MVDMTRFNTNLNYALGDDEGGSGPNYDITQDLLNQALLNLTLAIGYQIGYWNISTMISTTQMVNKYTFATPRNFYIPYGLLLILSIPILVLAMMSLYQNGVPAEDGGFIQVLMTTRGNKDLDRLAAAGCLGGSNNVPKALEDLELRFGGLDLVVVVRFNRCKRMLSTALRASKVLLVDYTLYDSSQYYSLALQSVFAYNDTSSNSLAQYLRIITSIILIINNQCLLA
jgi:hypothetical protein